MEKGESKRVRDSSVHNVDRSMSGYHGKVELDKGTVVFWIRANQKKSHSTVSVVWSPGGSIYNSSSQ